MGKEEQTNLYFFRSQIKEMDVIHGEDVCRVRSSHENTFKNIGTNNRLFLSNVHGMRAERVNYRAWD
jgi:hypothetical protein